MNRRTFFGAVIGGTVSSRIAAGGMLGSVRNTRTTPNRFTQETKLGDYFFYWTGWKKSINVPVNVAQWIAEPVDEINLEFSRDYYEREHPAFYAATTGTQGALVNMNYVMDLSYQPEFPLITDKASSEDKKKARDEALDRLVKYIESWEVPERQYVVASNSHMIHRENLKPGDLIPVDHSLPLSETLGYVLKKDGLTVRALKKLVKNG